MSQPVSDHQRLVDKLIERNPDESEKEHCSWLWELADGDQDNVTLIADEVIDMLIAKGWSERAATRDVTKALCDPSSGDPSWDHSIVKRGKLLTRAEWTTLTVKLVRNHLMALDDVTLQRYYKDAELEYPEGYVPKPIPPPKLKPAGKHRPQ